MLEGFRKEGIVTGNIDVFNLNISVIDSVKEFASSVKESYSEIHYLVNNGKNCTFSCPYCFSHFLFQFF